MPAGSTTGASADARPPWSPFLVSAITLILPAGGAILTIRNLERLHQIDPASARNTSIAVLLIFVAGMTCLLLLATPSHTGAPQIDSNAGAILYCGIAVVSYFAQRLPYRTWRAKHSGDANSPWLTGVGLALGYQIIAVIVIVPLVLIASAVGLGNLPVGRL